MQEHFSVGVHSFLPVNNREPRVQGYTLSFQCSYIKLQEHFSVGVHSFLPGAKRAGVATLFLSSVYLNAGTFWCGGTLFLDHKLQLLAKG